MSQFVLLYSTGGPREHEVHVAVECSGRKLTTQEAQEHKLMTPEQLFHYRNIIPYDLAWYEVDPGDEIVFEVEEWVWESEDDGYPRRQRLTYVVPDGGLPNPPVDIYDAFRRPGGLLRYYGEHAAQKHY